MKTIFNTRTALATVAMAVSFSLMSFSSETYVPSSVGSSKAVQVSPANGQSDIGIYPITRLITNPVMTYTRLTRYITYTDLEVATTTIITNPGTLTYDNEAARKMIAKTIQTKMKALG